MIFGQNCREDKQWFAWHPVRLTSGKIAWLEYVFRYKECWPTENWIAYRYTKEGFLK